MITLDQVRERIIEAIQQSGLTQSELARRIGVKHQQISCYVKGQKLPEPGLPESFRVLTKELQALALDIRMLDENGEEIDARKIEDEERRFPTSIDTTPEQPEVTDEEVAEVEGDFSEDEESFDDLDSAIDELFSDDEEESNEE